MLKAGAFIRVARGKITEYHTEALSQRPNAKDVLFRACKHGFEPAPPYLADAEKHDGALRPVAHLLLLELGREVHVHAVVLQAGAYTRPLFGST